MPFKDRLSHASRIIEDYNVAEKMDLLNNENNIQPDIPLLEKALKRAWDSFIEDGKIGYTLD